MTRRRRPTAPTLPIRAATPRDRATYDANFTGRVGNLPRNYGRGFPYFEAHVRVSKFIDLSRARLDRVELFIEALNVTNYVNLGTPQGNLRSAAFGQATGINGDSSPRQVEIGFRVDF